ncbi:MAG: GreA/GreB family elongation factor [Candidatus Kuenenia sp.]|nr:GreA/GreB family elongation factor [Candidatus Kuenenia hertensis]
MNKIHFIEKLITMLKASIEEQKKSFESARQASIDSAGRMQSRYDTMGIESAWVADGLARALHEKESNLRYLETFHCTEPATYARVGSIVKTTSSDSPDHEYFFILPVMSGCELCENGTVITTLSPETPLGRALIGKEAGEKIEVNFPVRRTITIEELM